MEKIAIDVALLLPEKLDTLCRKINRKNNADRHSDLSKLDNYPHITLAMGGANENDLPKIITKLDNITRMTHPLALTIIDAETVVIPINMNSYEFIVSRTDEIKQLHAEIIKALSPLFASDVTKDVFYIDPDEKFNEISKDWVENYVKTHIDPDSYHPHISLKCGRGDYTKFPIPFTSSQLAIC